jgi:hypothetical protein
MAHEARQAEIGYLDHWPCKLVAWATGIMGVLPGDSSAVHENPSGPYNMN